MKVLYITHDTENKSGWGRMSVSIIESLQKRSISVGVVVESEHPANQHEIYPPTSVLRIISNMRKARKIAKDFDIVHALDVWPYALYAFCGVWGTRKKLFINGVGTYSIAPLTTFFKRLILKPVLKRAERIFCISSFVKKSMLRFLSLNNISVVHLGFTALPLLTKGEEENFKEKYNINFKHRPIILTVGAIKHRKGQMDTLIALNMLRKKYPDIQYIMVGDTSDTQYVTRIKDSIRNNHLENQTMIIPDANTDKALSFFYSICDVFVMNSNNQAYHIEGFGLVFLEAAGFGKPVVGSNNCGIEDALKDGFNGYLSLQGNHTDIANKIEMAIENRDLLGENSREFIHKFSWQKTTDTYIEFYKMV